MSHPPSFDAAFPVDSSAVRPAAVLSSAMAPSEVAARSSAVVETLVGTPPGGVPGAAIGISPLCARLADA
ncbi:hypothetical protein ACFQ0M_33870 [Kitasatospora aburaviensis]